MCPFQSGPRAISLRLNWLFVSFSPAFSRSVHMTWVLNKSMPAPERRGLHPGPVSVETVRGSLSISTHARCRHSHLHSFVPLDPY